MSGPPPGVSTYPRPPKPPPRPAPIPKNQSDSSKPPAPAPPRPFLDRPDRDAGKGGRSPGRIPTIIDAPTTAHGGSALGHSPKPQVYAGFGYKVEGIALGYGLGLSANVMLNSTGQVAIKFSVVSHLGGLTIAPVNASIASKLASFGQRFFSISAGPQVIAGRAASEFEMKVGASSTFSAGVGPLGIEANSPSDLAGGFGEVAIGVGGSSPGATGGVTLDALVTSDPGFAIPLPTFDDALGAFESIIGRQQNSQSQSTTPRLP